MKPIPIAKVIQETLDSRAKTYSRTGEDNPYASLNKNNPKKKKKYLTDVARTPYIYMVSQKKIQGSGNIISKKGFDKENTTTESKAISDAQQEFEKETTEGERGVIVIGNQEYSKTQGSEGLRYGKDIYDTRDTKRYRPSAGIKSLSSEYQSTANVNFVKTITINWSCFSLEDLTILSQRFLTLDRKVYVEWGWASPDMSSDRPALLKEDGNFVYDTTIEQLTQLYDKDDNPITEPFVKQISVSAATLLRKKVIEIGQGNFDAAIGYVSNFSISSREDGGFDCTTDLVVNGVSILDGKSDNDDEQNDENMENKFYQNESAPYSKSGFKLELNRLPYFLQETLVEQYHQFEGHTDILKAMQPEDRKKRAEEAGFIQETSYYDYSTAGKRIISKKAIRFEDLKSTSEQFLANKNMIVSSKYIKDYINVNQGGDIRYNKKWGIGRGEVGLQVYDRTQYTNIDSLASPMVNFQADKDIREPIAPEDCWIRWGWFEDNLLNRYFGLLDENKDPVVQFRSIDTTETQLSSDDTNKEPALDITYESKTCKDNPDFKTNDINKFLFVDRFSVKGKGVPFNKKFFNFIKDISDEETKKVKEPTENQNIDEISIHAKFDNYVKNNPKGPIGENKFYEDKEIQNIISNPSRLTLADTQAYMDMTEFGLIPLMRLKGLQKVCERMKPRFTNDKKKNQGKIRNIFVNVRHLQQVFDSPDNTLGENLNRFLSSLSAETFGMIQLKAVVSPLEETRIGLETKTLDNEYAVETEKIENEKMMYEFPVWRSDSFVKSQELTTDISSEIFQALLSKKYLEMDVSDTGISLIHQADLNKASSFGKIIIEKVKGIITPKNLQPPFLFGGGFLTYGQKDGDETKELKPGQGATSISADESDAKRRETDDENELRVEEALGQKDAEIQSQVFRVTNTDYTATGQLKLQVKKDISNKLKFVIEDAKGPDGEVLKGEDGLPIKKIVMGVSDYGLVGLQNTLQLSGIAGITPGNVFVTAYLPEKFTKFCHFWTTNVEQSIDSSDWSTSITGRMAWKLRDRIG